MLAMLFTVSMLVGLFLPRMIPLHWDRQGVADKIGLKYELIFLLPVTALLIFIIGSFAESRLILPSQKIRGFMSFMQFFFITLVFVLQIRGLLRASNVLIPLERLMTIPALLLYIFVSGMFYNAEYLSLFGIKTKWTLNSRPVWERTNRLACLLFRICAGLMLIPIFLYELFYIFLAVPPILSLIAVAIYSKRVSDDENKSTG